MAILEKNGALHGKAGTVVFRRFRERVVVQNLPKKTKKQTAASKASASEFGLVSTTAAAIRKALKPVFLNRCQGTMINRFNSAVGRSIRGSRTAARGARDLHEGDLSFLEGFEFNGQSPLSQVLGVRPRVSLNEAGFVRVQMDAVDTGKDLKIPSGLREMTDWFRLKLLVTAMNFRSEFYQYVAVKELEVREGEKLEAQDLVMEGEIPAGCILLVTLSLECLAEDKTNGSSSLINTMEFSPAAIVGAFHAAENAEMGQSAEQRAAVLMALNGKGVIFMDVYVGNEILEKSGNTEKRPDKVKKKRKREEEVLRATGRAAGGTESPKESITEQLPALITGKKFRF